MADETNEADSGGKPDPNDVAALHRRIAALERELARRSGDDHGDADALRELGLRLADELDPERIAHAAVEVAAALTGAAPAVFLRAADGDAGHVLVAGAGAAADAIAAFAAPEHAALFAPTLRGDPHAPASGAPTRSLLAAAVKARSGVHGGLFLGHVDPGVFGAREQCLLAGIAAQAALALDRAREVTAGEHAREELARLADSFEQRVDERIDALRRHELRFQQLISGIADYAIFLLDAEGRVMTWNTGAERITGYSAAEAVGRDFSQFYTPEDRAAGEPQRALRVAAERGKYEAEAWRVRKDGTRFIANVLLDAIRDGGGRVVGFAKVTRDMTERRAMEERLRQSQKVEAIGQLTGGVAHDFNNLLTVIIGNLETICRRSVDDARLRHAADQAMRAAQRAAALTQQLLAFSRRQPLNPKPVDMNRLVASMSDLLRRTLGERIVIETVLAGGLWSAEVDVHQLENALLNLAVNARDAMPRGGRLTIETANAHIDASAGGEYADLGPGDYVMIRVGDSGIGMSKDVLEHAFEPFFTTKPIGQGTGLGLSQVYGFVTQSGGHVKIHSVPGEGTSIRIYLPRASTPAVTEPAAAPAATPRGSETILVVEDDGDVRLFGVETLRDLGFAVLDAPDGPSALKLLEQHPEIDLLFTDVGLPGLNGRQLAEQARQRHPRLKVLFATGYVRDAIVHEGRLDEGVELLTKPFTRAQLAGRVRDVLDAPAPGQGRGPVALLVEDEPMLRELTASMLRELGFETREAGSVAEALESANTDAPDVALIDVSLGERSGLELVDELRGAHPRLPIILTTGYGDTLRGTLPADDDHTTVLAKPYGAHRLRDALAQHGLLRGPAHRSDAYRTDGAGR